MEDILHLPDSDLDGWVIFAEHDVGVDVDADVTTDSTLAAFASDATFATFDPFFSFATLTTFDTFATLASFASFASFSVGDPDVGSHLH